MQTKTSSVSHQKKRSRAKSPIRDAIRRAVKARGMTGYRLAKELSGKVSRTAVYRFLRDGKTTDVATAEAFFEVLGLRVVEDQQ
jgi:ribosome-binding protein aMBF1 (putative translation factor)